MTDGQAARQPLTTDSGAAAIESLLTDDGDLIAQPKRAIDDDEPEESGAKALDDDEEPETPAPADDEADENAEPEQAALETLDDVAQALGIDTKDLMDNLKMRIKVNGEERLVSLAEAQKGQQLEADYRRKTTEIAEQRKHIEAEYAQRQALYQQQAVELAAQMQLAEQAVVADLNTPAMQELRRTNPAEWNARQFEAQQKLGSIQQARQYAAHQWQQQQQNAQAEQQRQFSAYLASEQNALQDAFESRGIPWTHDQKAKLSEFMQSRYGFAPQDVSQVYNHRWVLMALDAMQSTSKAKEMETKASAVKEKLKTVPPVMAKPGKQQGKVEVQRQKLAALKGRLRSSGNLRDAAAVIESLM